jgi:predicted CoA-binding protein
MIDRPRQLEVEAGLGQVRLGLAETGDDADAAGIEVVQDRCMLAEHRRLLEAP